MAGVTHSPGLGLSRMTNVTTQYFEDVSGISRRCCLAFVTETWFSSPPTAALKRPPCQGGLVPLLRERRAAALAEGAPEAQPPVLVLRDWYDEPAANGEELFSAVLDGAIDDLELLTDAYADALIREALEHDRAALRSVTRMDSAEAQLRAFIASTGGLVLVLDQFEEAIQGSAAQASELLDLVFKLHRRLRPELRMVGPSDETFFTNSPNTTRPPTRSADLSANYPRFAGMVRTAIEEAAVVGSLEISPGVIDRVLEWMVEAAAAPAVPARAAAKRLRAPAPARSEGVDYSAYKRFFLSLRRWDNEQRVACGSRIRRWMHFSRQLQRTPPARR